MEPIRRFDDREIALISKRAGHLQESAQGNPGNEGLTLEQLQEIARDVGIAPEYVTQAAQAVARGERGHRLRLSTRKGSAQSTLGLGFLVGSGLFALLGATGAVASNAATSLAAIVAAGGLVQLASTAFTLPRWARTRASQMDSIAAQAGRLRHRGRRGGRSSPLPEVVSSRRLSAPERPAIVRVLVA